MSSYIFNFTQSASISFRIKADNAIEAKTMAEALNELQILSLIGANNDTKLSYCTENIDTQEDPEYTINEDNFKILEKIDLDSMREKILDLLFETECEYIYDKMQTQEAGNR